MFPQKLRVPRPDLLLQFAEGGVNRRLAFVDSALGERPPFHDLVYAPGAENLPAGIDQHDPDAGAIGEIRVAQRRPLRGHDPTGNEWNVTMAQDGRRTNPEKRL